MANTLTTNFVFKKPAAGDTNWHDEMWENFDAIDALLGSILSSGNYVGIWQNSTAYTVGDRVVDDSNHNLYQCAVDHTSHASNDFITDRANNPTYWVSADTNEQIGIETVSSVTPTVVASWAGKIVQLTGVLTGGFALPDTATLALPVGWTCTFMRDNASGSWYIDRTGSDTLTIVGNNAATQVYFGSIGSMVTVVKLTSSRWLVMGDVS